MPNDAKKSASLFLVSMSPAIWAQFTGFYVERFPEGERPEFTPHGAWVTSDEFVDVALGDGKVHKSPKLLAGCCFYPTVSGPFMVCEYVSTRPGIPLRLAHAACERIAMAIRSYGAMTGLRSLTFPKHKGVRKMLLKAGFTPVDPKVSVLWSGSWCPAGVVEFPESNGVSVVDREATTLPPPAGYVAEVVRG